jgi:hypothetical protein
MCVETLNEMRGVRSGPVDAIGSFSTFSWLSASQETDNM